MKKAETNIIHALLWHLCHFCCCAGITAICSYCNILGKPFASYFHIYSHFYAFSQYINMNAMNTNNLNWNLAYTEILKENYGKWLSKIDVLKCNKYSELIAACFGLACSDRCTCHCSCLTLPNKWLSWLYCQFIVNICNSLWCFTVFNLLICLQFF